MKRKMAEMTEEEKAKIESFCNDVHGEHFYTKNPEERDALSSMGWSYEGISMYAYEKGSGYGTPTYRLYAPFPDAHGQYQHIFTVHEDERIALLMAGYNDEGIAWNVK